MSIINKLRKSIFLRSLGLLFLPLLLGPLINFSLYPQRPHCALGEGMLGCTPDCEPVAYFDNGKPSGYREIPCFHGDPSPMQVNLFENQYTLPSILAIGIVVLIAIKGIKSFGRMTRYIAFAPFYLIRENKENKNRLSRTIVMMISMLLMFEWGIGYYVLLMSFK